MANGTKHSGGDGDFVNPRDAHNLKPVTEYNLDGMYRAELFDFVCASRNFRIAAQKLFPGRALNVDTFEAAINLHHYADVKFQAMIARDNGDIPRALDLEAELDWLYKSLPSWAKGW